MKRVILTASACLAVAAVPALAAKPTHPTHPTHPAHPAHPNKGGNGKGNGGGQGHGTRPCKMRVHGYRAVGVVENATFTPGTSKHRFNGSITVTIVHASHHGTTGSQTFTLSDAKVHFGRGVDPTNTTGDPVLLRGKVTGEPKRCNDSGTGAVAIRSLYIKAPKR